MEAVTVIISEKDIENFSKYLYERENAEATIQKYVSDVRRFYDFLENEKIIDKRRILEYKERLVEKYAVRSVNSIIAAINQFLEFLHVADMKMRRIKMQKTMFLSEEKELTRQEFHKLVREARRIKKEWLALVMETIASTGIRISELKFFTVENVKKGKIEIYNKGKYRRILIPGKIQNQLLKYAKTRGILRGIIFISKTGRVKDRSLIWKEMKELKKKTGISGDKIFPHNLRHLFARTYYQFTKDIAGLADLLGHSNLNVTRIYTANTGKMYQKQLEKMWISQE